MVWLRFIHIYIHIHTYIQLIVVHNAKGECRDTVITALRKLRVKYVNTHTYTHIHTNPHTHTHIYISIHTQIVIDDAKVERCDTVTATIRKLRVVYMNAHTYTHIHTHPHTSAHPHANIHIHTYTDCRRRHQSGALWHSLYHTSCV